MTEIIHKNESYAIIGACFEVYNERVVAFWNRSIAGHENENRCFRCLSLMCSRLFA